MQTGEHSSDQLTPPVYSTLAQTDVGYNPGEWGEYIGNAIPRWIEDAQNYAAAVAENPFLATPALLGLTAMGAVVVGTKPSLYHAKKNLQSVSSATVIGDRENVGFFDFFNMPVWIKWADRCTHTQLIGPPNAGKTTILLPWIIQDLKSGRTVAIVQIYGDLADKARDYARALGASIVDFDVSNPNTIKLNLLVGEDTEDVADRAANALRGAVSAHDHYTNIAEDVTRNFVILARRYAASKGLSEDDADNALVCALLDDHKFLEAVLDLKRPLDDNGRQSGEVKVNAPWLDYHVCTFFEQHYYQWGEQVAQQNLSEVSLFFRRLVNRTRVRESMCPRPGDDVLDLFAELRSSADRAEEQAEEGEEHTAGKLIIIKAPTDPKAAGPNASRYIAYWALKTIQDATQMREEGDHPLAVYLDELPTLLGQGSHEEVKAFIDWLAIIRKYNVAIVVSYQSYSQVPEDVARSLDANARNKIVKGGLSDDDTRKVMRMTTEEQTAESENVTDGAMGTDHVNSRTRRTQEKSTFSYRDIKGMHRSEAIWISTQKGRDQKAIKLNVTMPKPPEHYRVRRHRRKRRQEAQQEVSRWLRDRGADRTEPKQSTTAGGSEHHE